MKTANYFIGIAFIAIFTSTCIYPGEQITDSSESTPKDDGDQNNDRLEKLHTLIVQAQASGIIKKIDENSETAWIDPNQWSSFNRDDKEFIINLVGAYFFEKKNLEYPKGYIKSFANDKLLGETKMFGGVEMYE